MGKDKAQRAVAAPDFARYGGDGGGNLERRLVAPGDLNHIVKRETFEHGVDISAVADTDQVKVTPGGFRLFGDGLNDADNGGLLAVSGAPAQRMSSSNVGDEIVAIGCDAAILDPDTNGPFRFSAAVSFNNIATKHCFMGFVKAAADAMSRSVTYSGTTLTTVDTDLAGVTFSTDMGDGDRWYVVYGDNNDPATNETTDTGVDTGKNVVASKLTFVTVEIDANGNFFWAIRDDAGVASGKISAAVDITEGFAAVLYIGAAGDATEEIDLYGVELDYFVDGSFD